MLNEIEMAELTRLVDTYGPGALLEAMAAVCASAARPEEPVHAVWMRRAQALRRWSIDPNFKFRRPIDLLKQWEEES